MQKVLREQILVDEFWLDELNLKFNLWREASPTTVDDPEAVPVTDGTGNPVLDENGNPVLDENGNPVIDGTGELIGYQKPAGYIIQVQGKVIGIMANGDFVGEKGTMGGETVRKATKYIDLNESIAAVAPVIVGILQIVEA